MTITTKTKTGVEVLLSEKNEQVFAELEVNGEKLAGAVKNAYGGKEFGWVAGLSCTYRGEYQQIKLTIPEADFRKIEAMAEAKKIKRIKSEESVLQVTWGCDTADTVHIAGAMSLLIDSVLKPFLHAVLLKGYGIPAGAVRREATTMSYGGWTAKGAVADTLVMEALERAKVNKIAREKKNKAAQEYQDSLCPICYSVCYGECLGG